jgi:hypothetical protein
VQNPSGDQGRGHEQQHARDPAGGEDGRQSGQGRAPGRRAVADGQFRRHMAGQGALQSQPGHGRDDVNDAEREEEPAGVVSAQRPCGQGVEAEFGAGLQRPRAQRQNDVQSGAGQDGQGGCGHGRLRRLDATRLPSRCYQNVYN